MPTAQDGGGGAMVRGMFSWHTLGSLIPIRALFLSVGISVNYWLLSSNINKLSPQSQTASLTLSVYILQH